MWKLKLGNTKKNSDSSSAYERITNINTSREKFIQILKKNSTPFFIINQEMLINRYDKLKQICLKEWGNFQGAYSFKTNYEVANTGTFKRLGLWAEVVSGYEYKLAKELGFNGSQIIFNGPSKTEEDLQLALKDNALVMIDNFEELRIIKNIAASFSTKESNVGIRMRSNIESRFGFLIENGEAENAVKEINNSTNLKLNALHMHIGSDIDNIKQYKKSAKRMAFFIQKNAAILKNDIEYIDMGGGFPAHGLAPFRRTEWNPQEVQKYVEVITKELSKLFPTKKPTLILEPGRYLVDDAVSFVTRVIGSRKYNDLQTLIIDATLSMLPLAEYRQQTVKLFDNKLRSRKTRPIKTKIYGASCRENDILYENPFSSAKVGDLLIFFIVGAYNQSMSSNFIFEKPKSILFLHNNKP